MRRGFSALHEQSIELCHCNCSHPEEWGEIGELHRMFTSCVRDENKLVDRTHSRSAHTMIDLRLINEDIEIVGSSARYSEPKDVRDNIRSS